MRLSGDTHNETLITEKILPRYTLRAVKVRDCSVDVYLNKKLLGRVYKEDLNALSNQELLNELCFTFGF